MLEQLSFAFGVTAPILLLLLAGFGFRRVGLIDEAFINSGNKLVFNVGLPAILFFGIADFPIAQAFDGPLLAYALAVTIASVVLLSCLAMLSLPEDMRGVFVQGAFRGNMGIIGLALVINAFGEGLLPVAGVYVAVLTLAYNILSVWVLRSKGGDWLWQMLKNPLMISIFVGAAWSALALPLPAVVARTGEYVSQLTLPLALLCIGANLRWHSLRGNGAVVLSATAFKLAILPAAAVAIAVALGFEGERLGMLFLMVASPSAAASYVMAAKMTRHGALAAEIVVVTTALSGLSITAGLVLLRAQGLI